VVSWRKTDLPAVKLLAKNDGVGDCDITNTLLIGACALLGLGPLLGTESGLAEAALITKFAQRTVITILSLSQLC